MLLHVEKHSHAAAKIIVFLLAHGNDSELVGRALESHLPKAELLVQSLGPLYSPYLAAMM